MLLGIVAILLLFIFTNPSLRDLKEFVGTNSYDGLHKSRNFFLWSCFADDQHNKKYIGVLGNLFELKNETVPLSTTKTILIDSPTTPKYISNNSRDVIKPFDDLSNKKKTTTDITVNSKNPFIIAMKKYKKEHHLK